VFHEGVCLVGKLFAQFSEINIANFQKLVNFPPEDKAEMAELVDAPDLGSGVLGRAGSIPVLGIFIFI
jgi:hypothetical protein